MAALHNRDMDKVVAAGFNILRREYNELRIKIRSQSCTWKTLEKNFGTKAALDRRMDELLKHPKNIEA